MVQATVSWAALPSWPEMGKPGSSETRAGAASVVGKLVAAVDGRARACLVAISDQLGFPSLILWGAGWGCAECSTEPFCRQGDRDPVLAEPEASPHSHT